MKNLLTTVLEYLTHSSTWQGLAAAAIAAGVNLDPAHQSAIVTAGAALFALIQIFVKDSDKDNTTAVAAVLSPKTGA